ncbi:MAG: sensor histidine kinase, partial [Sporomusa sp.]
LNGIVNDLLNYANPRKVEREQVSLKQLIDNALVFFADKIASRDIELQLDVKEDLTVVVDCQQMKQVMINLLLNALEAMAGCPRPVLVITGERRDGQVWLLIVDNGDGIVQQDQQFIFEPFFSTRTGGTGLGLFVSYQLARQNGVEIVVDSKKQSGTKVYLKFSQQEDQYTVSC